MLVLKLLEGERVALFDGTGRRLGFAKWHYGNNGDVRLDFDMEPDVQIVREELLTPEQRSGG